MPTVKETRRALLDLAAGWQDVAVYAYDALGSGHTFAGPAIVEAPTTTVVVPDGATASIDRVGNLVLTYR
jgi:N-methylhydantoinase A